MIQTYSDILDPYRRKVTRAEAGVAALRQELLAAEGALAAAKRSLQVASASVSQAQEVAALSKRPLKISDATRTLIIGLAGLDIFGQGELVETAEKNGTPLRPDAARQRIVKLSDLGLIKKVSRGNYRVDRATVADLLGVDLSLGRELDCEVDARTARSENNYEDLASAAAERRERMRAERNGRESDYDDELEAEGVAAGIEVPESEREAARPVERDTTSYHDHLELDDDMPF